MQIHTQNALGQICARLFPLFFLFPDLYAFIDQGWIAVRECNDLRMLGVMMKAISVAASKLNPRVTQSYLLNNLLAAFAAITERRELGKVILTMGWSTSCIAQASLWTGSRSHLLPAIVPPPATALEKARGSSIREPKRSSKS
jgi:hypothetical protein